MANFGGFEIEDGVQESPSANTFGGFEIEDEEPSTLGQDAQTGLEQPTAEPTPKKRGITMSPDEMNVPAASLLTKDEAKEMESMGANEIAARSYEQTTGADAPKSGLLAQIANMGLAVGGRLNANLQMSAAQQLASDEERKDLDTSKLFSQMIFGLGKYNFFRPASALDEWDDSDGLSYKTPEERTAARNAFARELARQFIAERTATKQNAATELENREQGHVATIFGKGPAQVGYSLPYMLGPIGIGLQFAEESAANAARRDRAGRQHGEGGFEGRDFGRHRDRYRNRRRQDRRRNHQARRQGGYRQTADSEGIERQGHGDTCRRCREEVRRRAQERLFVDIKETPPRESP